VLIILHNNLSVDAQNMIGLVRIIQWCLLPWSLRTNKLNENNSLIPAGGNHAIATLFSFFIFCHPSYLNECEITLRVIWWFRSKIDSYRKDKFQTIYYVILGDTKICKDLSHSNIKINNLLWNVHFFNDSRKSYLGVDNFWHLDLFLLNAHHIVLTLI